MVYRTYTICYMELPMEKFAFWFDEQNNTFRRIGIEELSKIYKSDDRRLGLRIKENLFYFKNMSVRMTAVINAERSRRGFRRRSSNLGNSTSSYRGSNESLTHAANKEAIANLSKIKVLIAGVTVKLFVQEIVPEEAVICNGRRYKVDLKIVLLKTEPEIYQELFNGELWFELCHRCPIDTKQAEDFAVEGKALFEYVIPQEYNVFDNITTEGYEKRIAALTGCYRKKKIPGILICNHMEYEDVIWKRKEETGNLVAMIDGNVITITKNRFSDGYVFYLDGWHKEYNGKSFLTEKDAVMNAQFIAFEKMNKNANKSNY